MSFFLENRKRDLSDKSRNGEDAKKVKENAESTGSLSDEVFSDGLNSPECAKILVNCLRNIENQVKELFILNEETKNAQIKVTESLEFFSNKFDELERENKKKNEKIKKLEETIDILTEKNKSLTSDVDELEQYSRRNCLILNLRLKSRKMIWTGHTGLVIETGKMVSRELLLSNLPSMPPEIRFIPIRKN